MFMIITKYAIFMVSNRNTSINFHIASNLFHFGNSMADSEFLALSHHRNRNFNPCSRFNLLYRENNFLT